MSVYKIKVVKNELICYGTCFSVDSKHVITACHTIIENSCIFLHINDIWEPCKIVNNDYRLDLCLLQIETVVELYPRLFELITTNCEIYCNYFSNENENLISKNSKIVCKNSVSELCMDSIIINFVVPQGASGCPSFNKNNGKILGIITWSDKNYSGGCVNRIINQFYERSLSTVKLCRYCLDINIKYHESSECVKQSNVENIPVNTIIKKINGNTIGKKYLGIESLLYFSTTNSCTVTLTNNNEIIADLVEFEKSKLLHDKALSNMSILDCLYLT